MSKRMISEERALWLARHVLPHEPALRAQLGRWRLPGDLEPDDIVQEAYARFAGMASVAEILNPRAYLFGIARTLLLMHIRRAKVISIRSADDGELASIAGDDPTPEAQASDREQLHLLALAVAEMPEPGRRAFLLRTVDELSYREIGDRLGLSDNAVQKSVTKSLLRLMARFGRGGKVAVEASNPQPTEEVQQVNGPTRDERRD
jgi:RNA polymerase sigma factor (sigma-70 family)